MIYNTQMSMHLIIYRFSPASHHNTWSTTREPGPINDLANGYDLTDPAPPPPQDWIIKKIPITFPCQPLRKPLDLFCCRNSVRIKVYKPIKVCEPEIPLKGVLKGYKLPVIRHKIPTKRTTIKISFREKPLDEHSDLPLYWVCEL